MSGRGTLQRAGGTQVESVVEGADMGPRFLLPAALCAPVFEVCEADGPLQRTLLALLWVSVETLRRGEGVRFRAPAIDLRHVAGFSSYRSNVPVRRAAERLRSECCRFADGAELTVFGALEAVAINRQDVLEWVFDPEFEALFMNPERFAVIDIRESAALSKGLDLFLYRQVRLAWNLRRPVFSIAAADLRRAAGIDEAAGFRRVYARVRRSLSRVGALTGSDIVDEPIGARGGRERAGVRFSIRRHDT